MNFWKMGPRAAFEPPSDYVGDGGGSSGKKKFFMIAGVGCAGILLVIGILFAAGAFQAVSCCNEVGDAMKKTAGAQRVASDFGLDLAAGDFEGAYQRTTERYRAETTLETFTKAFDPYAAYLDATPHIFNVRASGANGEFESLEDLSKSWVVVLQFAHSSAREQLLVEVDVLPTEEGGFEIDGVRAEVRARSLESEPPAREVLEVHDELAAGRYEMAYGRMAQPFQQETKMEAFKAFVNDSEGIMTSSDVEIQEVEYLSGQQATVMATVTATNGTKAVVQYELQTPIPNMDVWKIMAISTPLQADPSASDGEPVVEEIDGGSVDADVIAPSGDE